MARERYTVVFERGDRPNQWLASVKELPHCHTYGRGIEQTRTRIREALAVWVGDTAATAADLVEELPLPATLRKRLGELRAAKEELVEVDERRRALQDGLVRELQGAWSKRDLGQLLGISHQRASQVGRSRKGRSGAAAKKG